MIAALVVPLLVSIISSIIIAGFIINDVIVDVFFLILLTICVMFILISKDRHQVATAKFDGVHLLRLSFLQKAVIPSLECWQCPVRVSRIVDTVEIQKL